MSELISQQVVDAAFDWLLKSSDEIAAARGNKIRKEYKSKKVFSRLYLNAEGSVETRKAFATCHPEYESAMEDVAIAEEVWSRLDDQRNRASLCLDAWRTEQASRRIIDRIR